MDSQSPRDGKVIEELGYYDPMVAETDARAVLNGERIDYWLGHGAKPTEKVGVLIKKYGSGGTHLEQQQVALARIEATRSATFMPPPPKAVPEPEAPAEEAPAEEAPAEEAPAEEAPAAEDTAAEAPAAEEVPAEDAGGEEKTE